MTYHLVFLRDEPLDAILERRQRWEFRLSQMTAPYMRTMPGDCLLLKRSGGEVEAVCRAGDVFRLDVQAGGSLEDFIALCLKVANQATSPYLRSKPGPRYGAAIELVAVRACTTFPARLTPRGVRMGWVADLDVGSWRSPAE